MTHLRELRKGYGRPLTLSEVALYYYGVDNLGHMQVTEHLVEGGILRVDGLVDTLRGYWMLWQLKGRGIPDSGSVVRLERANSGYRWVIE